MHKIAIILFAALLALIVTDATAQEMTPLKSPSRCKNSFKLQLQAYPSNVKTHSRDTLPYEFQAIANNFFTIFDQYQIKPGATINDFLDETGLWYKDWRMNKLRNEFTW